MRIRPGEPDQSAASQTPADDRDGDVPSRAIVDLPDVAWISARDATRAPGDLEDQAARYQQVDHDQSGVERLCGHHQRKQRDDHPDQRGDRDR